MVEYEVCHVTINAVVDSLEHLRVKTALVLTPCSSRSQISIEFVLTARAVCVRAVARVCAQ